MEGAAQSGPDRTTVKSTRIVATEIANGFILAALTLEFGEIDDSATVHQHVQE
jgi:hypothetical protein